jgi:hypothetical protein
MQSLVDNWRRRIYRRRAVVLFLSLFEHLVRTPLLDLLDRRLASSEAASCPEACCRSLGLASLFVQKRVSLLRIDLYLTFIMYTSSSFPFHTEVADVDLIFSLCVRFVLLSYVKSWATVYLELGRSVVYLEGRKDLRAYL